MAKSKKENLLQDLKSISSQNKLNKVEIFEKKVDTIRKKYDESLEECMEKYLKASPNNRRDTFPQEVLGCSKQSYYSSKKNLPKLEYFIKISEYLGCPLSVLFGEGDVNKLNINSGLTKENARKLRRYEYDIAKYRNHLSFINYYIEKSDDLIPMLNAKADIIDKQKELQNEYQAIIKEISKRKFKRESKDNSSESEENNKTLRVNEDYIKELFNEFMRYGKLTTPGKTYTDGMLKPRWDIKSTCFTVNYNKDSDSFDDSSWDTLIEASLIGFYRLSSPKKQVILHELFGIYVDGKRCGFNIPENTLGERLVNNIRDRFIISGAIKEIEFLLNSETNQIIQDFYILNYEKQQSLYDFSEKLIDEQMPEYTYYGKIIAYTNKIDSSDKYNFSYLAITINENDAAFRIATLDSAFKEVEVALDADNIRNIKKYNKKNNITPSTDYNMNKGKEYYLSSISGSYTYCKEIIATLYDNCEDNPIIWCKELF